MSARTIGICHCTACREAGRTLPTEWFIERTRLREQVARLERRRAA